MNHQLELSRLVVEVPDPSVLDAVFADIVGLVPGERPHTWRNDGSAERIVVQSGERNDAVAIGFDAVDDAAFAATVDRLRAAGFDVRVDGSTATTAAPWGVAVDIGVAPTGAGLPFSSALVPGGFLTDGLGFGHVVFATTEFDESVRFLCEGLGFEQSDWLEMEPIPGITLEVRFFHCNPRHHTVALARAPFELPQALHHVMFEMNDRDDVGAAFDRCWASELPIPNGLGQHPNDRMFSFYLQTPAGFQVEVGHGARVVGDDWDEDQRYDAISAWGHQALRS